MSLRVAGALLVLVLSLAAQSIAADRAEAVLMYISDTYGCLGAPNWPGGVARHKTFAEQIRRTHPDAVFVHTGNALSPFYFSRVDKGALYVKLLDRIGGVVWNLGFHDVDFGWPHLTSLRRDLKNTAVLTSNLRAPDAAPEAWLVRNLGGLRVGFLGLMDPRAAKLTVVGMFQGLAIEDPIRIAKETVARRRGEVDAIVAIADLEEDDAERLAREVPGLDLVISGSRHARDWYTFFEGRPARQVLTRRRADGSATTMVNGARDGFELGKVTLRAHREGGGWRLDDAATEVIALPPDGPQDPELWRQVKARVEEVDRLASEVVLDKLSLRFPNGVDAERLTTWTAGALREAVDAEVAVLNRGALFKPEHYSEQAVQANAISQEQIEKTFWAPNHVMKFKLLGSHLLQVLEDDAELRQLVTAGLTRDGTSWKVNGRALLPARHYLVAATDYLLAVSAKSRGLTQSLRADGLFEVEDGRLEPSASGRKYTLGEVFRMGLAGWRSRHVEPDGAEPFSRSPYPTERNLFIRGATASVGDYRVEDNQFFPQVRNPRIRTNDYRNISGTGEIALEQDARESLWTAGARYSYVGTKVEKNPTFNPEDDLVLFTDVTDRSRAVAGSMLGLTFHPWAELAHDTEFTATRGNPRDKLARFTAGVSGLGTGAVTRLRLGTLAEYDWSLNSNTEYGFAAGIRASAPVWGMRLETVTDGRWYLDSSEDTTDDLKYELYSNNQLVVPVTRELSVSLMGNLFYYRGKVIEQDGSNIFLGLALRFDKLWKTFYESFDS